MQFVYRFQRLEHSLHRLLLFQTCHYSLWESSLRWLILRGRWP
jgi:hypothetical protein